MFLQMGMRDTFVGTLCYYFVVCSGFSVLGLLAALSENSYHPAAECSAGPDGLDCVDQAACKQLVEACVASHMKLLVYDGTLCQTFIIVVWTFGAIFLFVAKYPTVLRYHFRTRCGLKDATTVRIFVPKGKTVVSTDQTVLRMHACTSGPSSARARLVHVCPV
jgi:hypothetical protein